MIATQDITFGVASQTLILDCEDGPIASVTSVSVYESDDDDTATPESATTGSATVDATATTLTAAAGASTTDPKALTVSSGTGISVGRRYELVAATGAYEHVEIAGTVQAARVVAQTPTPDRDEGLRQRRREQAQQAQSDVLGLDGRFTTEGALANLLDKLGFSDRLTNLLSGSTAVAKIIGRAAPQVQATGLQGTIAGGDFTGTGFALANVIEINSIDER